MRRAFSPDGKVLAVAGEDRNVRVWDDLAAAPRIFQGHTDQVLAVAFSPDGAWLASASMDQTVRIWEVASGQERFTLRGHNGPATAVLFAPTGVFPSVTLVSGAQDGLVKVWSPQKRPNPLRLTGHTAGVGCVRLSPDGRLLASASTDERKVRLWDLSTGREQLSLACSAYSVAFSPDGRHLVTTGGNPLATDQPGEVLLWDLEHPGRPARPFRGHGKFVMTAVFSPDGKYIASASANPRGASPEDRNGEIKVWEVAGGKERLSFRLAQGHANSLAISSDSRFLAVAAISPTLQLFDLLTGKEVRSFQGASDGVFSVAFSPDGRALAGGSAKGNLFSGKWGPGRSCVRFGLMRQQSAGWRTVPMASVLPRQRST